MNVFTQANALSNTAIPPPPPLETTTSQWFLSCASLDDDDDDDVKENDVISFGQQPVEEEADDDDCTASSVSTTSTIVSDASWPLSPSPTNSSGREDASRSSLRFSLLYMRNLEVLYSSTDAEMKEKETAATPLEEQHIHLLGGLKDLLLEE